MFVQEGTFTQLQGVGIGIFFGGVVGFLSVWLSRVRHLRQKQEVGSDPVNPVFSVECYGNLHQFKDTSLQFAGCPYCSEDGLTPYPENLRQHLGKHTFLRMVERPADEIRRLLAAG